MDSLATLDRRILELIIIATLFGILVVKHLMDERGRRARKERHWSNLMQLRDK